MKKVGTVVPIKEVVDLAKDETNQTFDASKMFLRLGYDKNKNNIRFRCQTEGCEWEGAQSHLEQHVRSKHSSNLQKYLESTGKGTKLSVLPFEKKQPPTKAELELQRKYEGTVGNLEKALARFLVLRRLPLEVANSPELNDLIRIALNLGETLDTPQRNAYTIPSRNTMINRIIEGRNGILADSIDEAYKFLKVITQDSSPSIIYDGAKDAAGRSVELFCLQAANKVVLLWTGLAGDQSKSHEWTHRCLKGILEGDMDFELMDVKSEEAPNLASTNTEENVAENDSAPRKKLKTQLIPELSRLFDFTNLVVAVGGDNASVPLLAAKKLSATHGVLYFGCVAHAFSRCFEHVCNIPAIRDSVVKKISTVTDIFLSHYVPRELLRKFSSGKSVYRIVPTRFITVFLAAKRLLDMKSSVMEVVGEVAFRDFLKSNSVTASVRTQGYEVIAIVNDAEFWKCLEFLLKLSVGFVVAVRCFDGALQGSVCLVYQFWSTLSHTVAKVFKDEAKNFASFATRELYEDIKKVILADWTKFLYPVYSAAYFLCPYFIEQVRYYQQHYPEWYKTLLKQTLDCCCTVFRRFSLDGSLRTHVLSPTDPLVIETQAKFKAELSDYVKMRGNFAIDSFSIESLKAPNEWWIEEGFKSPLRCIAAKIVSISPSTAPVERYHKLTKSIRTKSRNSIGYARALGLNFICAENLMKDCKDVAFSWNELQNYKARFASLSRPEEEYLEELAKEQSQEVTAVQERNDDMILTLEEVVDEQLRQNAGGDDSKEVGIEGDDAGSPPDEAETSIEDRLSGEVLFSDDY